MAERKQVNKYYPPDWDPSKGSVNKHVGQHPLRERARKLSQGILIIRFEMPYNIWCGGCGNHIGMGVRYNAEKKKVGNYYTTPIYRFRMKCHLCDNYIEIETDPKNCDYTIVAGARRKEERWDPAAAENVIATDHAEKQKLIDDAMFKLEHGDKDKRKSKAAIPGLVQIKDVQTQWKDDFSLNQMLRKKFRQEKKVILEREEKDQEIKDKGSLDLDLVNEDPDDIRLAKNIRFRAGGYEEEKRKRRLQIKSRPMFSETPDKNNHRASLLEKRQRMVLPSAANALTTIFTKNSEDVGIRRKSSDDLKKKECSANDAEKTPDRTIGEKLTNNCLSKTNFERAPSESECRKNKYSELKNGLHEERKINDLTNSTCKKEISKPEEHDKLPKCDVQQDVNSEGFIKNDQLFTSTCDQKANKHKQVSSNETSNAGSTNTLLNEDDYQSKKPKISLVSQLYSDTDSDSSK